MCVLSEEFCPYSIARLRRREVVAFVEGVEMQSTGQTRAGTVFPKPRANQGGGMAPVVVSATSTNGGNGTLVVPAMRHLNEVDLARRWRLSPRTVQAWRVKGLGPPYLKLMGRVCYRLADVIEFELANLRQADR